MMQLFDQTAFECSKLVTKRYSTSFSLGIRAFDDKYREPIYNIYGFVRFADEIVDTFHQQDKPLLLSEFRDATFQSIERGISLNPILHSFQHTVNKYRLDHNHITAFLDSMEMDLHDIEYDQTTLKKYIYGSAEVVGLMCLQVFCEGDQSLYQGLEPYAVSLGSAFQKINFLRDIKADYVENGRVYFPNVDFDNFSQADKDEIEKDIKAEFDHALIGIKRLPKGARLGVFLAFRYYLSLFSKIQSAPAATILSKRVRITNGKKMLLLTTSSIKNQLNLI